jgi:hypothetical protein
LKVFSPTGSSLAWRCLNQNGGVGCIAGVLSHNHGFVVVMVAMSRPTVSASDFLAVRAPA